MFLLVLTAGSLFTACKKNEAPPPENPVPEMVTANLQGRVIDENNLPVKDAQITSGTAGTTTDINGAFELKSIQLSKRFGYVEVKKTGYFTGSRTVATTANGNHYVEIELLPKQLKGSFATGSGGTITVAPGCTVAFEPNAVVNAATGAAYTGTANVYGAYLDPTSDRMPNQMPGDLRGLQGGTSEVGLVTYGMANVEMEGSGGEKLQLASGKKATLNFPLPAALQAAAPAIIPLWFFDAAKGTWVEEGSAAKQGSTYTGTVNHFSWWNADVPSNFVGLKLRLIYQANNPAAFTIVRIRQSPTNYGSSITNSNGETSGAVPRNVPLQLEVVSRCNTVIHSQSIGPFNTDADLGAIQINVPGSGVVFSGTVTGCNSQPVTLGFVNVKMEGINYRAAINNGSFSLTSFPRCATGATTAEISASDQTSGQSVQQTVPVNSGTVNTGAISICGSSTNDFISMTIDGVAYNIVGPVDPITCIRSGTFTVINGKNSFATNSPNYLQTAFSFSGNAAPGQYNLSLTTLRAGGLPYRAVGNVSCTVTAYGAVGAFVEGSFSGTVRQDSVANAPNKALQASFRTRRTQ